MLACVDILSKLATEQKIKKSYSLRLRYGLYCPDLETKQNV